MLQAPCLRHLNISPVESLLLPGLSGPARGGLSTSWAMRQTSSTLKLETARWRKSWRSPTTWRRTLQSNYHFILSRLSFTIFFSDEIPSDDLPWRKCKTSDCSPFSGFEEAGLDTVNELTKVITSNILNVDVPGKIKHFVKLNSTKIFSQITSQ